jgi:hypothetical protein
MAHVVVNPTRYQFVVSLKGDNRAPVVGKGASGNKGNGQPTNCTE